MEVKHDLHILFLVTASGSIKDIQPEAYHDKSWRAWKQGFTRAIEWQFSCSQPLMVHDEFEVLSQIQWFVACQHYATSWQQASQPRGRQRKKSTTPRGEISWNQVEIMRNQSRFPWNQARKSAQPSSPTHFYNIWRHFWGKSRGNQTEIRKSRTPKLLVADPSITKSGLPCGRWKVWLQIQEHAPSSIQTGDETEWVVFSSAKTVRSTAQKVSRGYSKIPSTWSSPQSSP